MSDRYVVTYNEDEVFQKCENKEDWESLYDDYCSSYLIDTKENLIVFSDRMEPEDASLGRALAPLVKLLNKNEEENNAKS